MQTTTTLYSMVPIYQTKHCVRVSLFANRGVTTCMHEESGGNVRKSAAPFRMTEKLFKSVRQRHLLITFKLIYRCVIHSIDGGTSPVTLVCSLVARGSLCL